MNPLTGLPDGYALGDGVVVSTAGGFYSPVFRCHCGREQSATYPGYSGGGIEATAAERVGWRRVNGEWVCPFCSGNEALLRRAWNAT
jgi:hypothetical protein